jgi:hypothetical protein
MLTHIRASRSASPTRRPPTTPASPTLHTTQRALKRLEIIGESPVRTVSRSAASSPLRRSYTDGALNRSLDRSIRSHLSVPELTGRLDVRSTLLRVSPSPGPVYAATRLETYTPRAPRAAIPRDLRDKYLSHSSPGPGPTYYTQVRFLTLVFIAWGLMAISVGCVQTEVRSANHRARPASAVLHAAAAQTRVAARANLACHCQCTLFIRSLFGVGLLVLCVSIVLTGVSVLGNAGGARLAAAAVAS